MRKYFQSIGRLLATTLGVVVVMPSIPVLFLAVGAAPGFFDRAYYRSGPQSSALRRRWPLVHYALRGARALEDPNPWFSQRLYLEQTEEQRVFPPVLDFLLVGRYRSAKTADGSARGPGRAVAPAPVAPAVAVPAPLAAPAVVPASFTPAALPLAPAGGVPPRSTPGRSAGARFASLWPHIAADLAGLRDVEAALSPTDLLRTKLIARPNAPLPTSPLASPCRLLLREIPGDVRHLVIVPWLGVLGGSEKVTERLLALLRQHYSNGGVCVVATDASFKLSEARRGAYGVPIVGINDVMPAASLEERVALLDRIVIETMPTTIHSINSVTAWLLFAEASRRLAARSNLFVNIYSAFRDLEIPVGFFWQMLPGIIDNLSGVLIDNVSVKRQAMNLLGLSPKQADRMLLVPTPVIGLGGGDPAADLRPFSDPGKAWSLWMSRIAREKRIDVLRAIVERCPDRDFTVFGATLEGSAPVDLDWTDSLSNVHYQGRFGRLSDLPVHRFDSYIFTTSAEGMPISMLEAAMIGLPIVAPNVGGIGEFIDEDTGWLIEREDGVDDYVAALAAVRADPAAAGQRVGAAQRRLVERYSWPAFAASVAAVPGYLQ